MRRGGRSNSLRYRALRHSRTNFLATAAGLGLMLVALANSFITLAGQDYRGVLLTALVCAALAVACLIVPLVRGPAAWRVSAVLFASPAAFVISDFARRAPHVFGGR